MISLELKRQGSDEEACKGMMIKPGGNTEWKWRIILLLSLPSLLITGAAGQTANPDRLVWPQRPATSASSSKQTSPPTPRDVLPDGEAQHSSSDQDQGDVIRLRSNLVVVPVSVTDASGRPVCDLVADDFLVEEEGKPQQVVSMGQPGKTPVTLAMLLDVSASVRERFGFEQQAISRFLQEVVKPGDSASVFSIGLEPKLVQPRTTSVEEMIRGVEKIEATRQATAFFDAVAEAARYLGKDPNPGMRRFLVVISDGEDNVSEHAKLADALRDLEQNGCIFYSINPGGPSIHLNVLSVKGERVMETLAAETGGAAFVPEKFEDLEAAFQQISAELQAQFLLGYYSTDERMNGEFRRISVRVPKRSGLRVRARQGYYPPKG